MILLLYWLCFIPTSHKVDPIVRFRLINNGSHYSDSSCGDCPQFPCSEGVVNNIIHPNGGFTPCRLPGKFYPFTNSDGSFSQRLFESSISTMEEEVIGNLYYRNN